MSRLTVVYGCLFFFFQAEDGIRDLVRSRGLGDVYKRQKDYWGKVFDACGLISHENDVDLLQKVTSFRCDLILSLIHI